MGGLAEVGGLLTLIVRKGTDIEGSIGLRDFGENERSCYLIR